MQGQKQIHTSQLRQQALNDVMLKLCDTIVLKTLPLVVQCKKFSLLLTISTKKFACFIVTLWIKLWQIEHYLWISLFALVLEFFLVRIFPYSGWIRTKKTSVFRHLSSCERLQYLVRYHINWSARFNARTSAV